MQISNQSFFEVVEIETQEKKVFESARDVSFFLCGLQSVFFKVFKNGKEVTVTGVLDKHLKSFLHNA